VSFPSLRLYSHCPMVTATPLSYSASHTDITDNSKLIFYSGLTHHLLLTWYLEPILLVLVLVLRLCFSKLTRLLLIECLQLLSILDHRFSGHASKGWVRGEMSL
jgi:hypothetical protein